MQLMKKLYIIRHAKSSWNKLNLEDFDRPLNKRGKKDAPFMGKILLEKGVIPDVIISSPAKRAKQTSIRIAKELRFKKVIIFDKKIYEAGPSVLEQILFSFDNINNTILLVGHNPGLNILVGNLVHFHGNIPTSGIIELSFDCERWSEISPKNATLVSFDYPKRHNL